MSGSVADRSYVSDPSVTSTWVEFRIYSDRIDPVRITEILGLLPSETVVKGERTGARHAGFPKHGWFLSSEEQALPKEARAHLDWTLDRLLEVRERYEALIETGDVTVSLCLFWWATEGSGPRVGAIQASKIAELGIDLNIQFQRMEAEVPGTVGLDA